MLCSISGEVPRKPVVSKVTGKVYEKDLLLKFVETNGKEPNSDQDFDETDIIEIKTEDVVAPPRPPTLTSIPSLLSVFQNEWDAVVLETFSLKQQYQQVRQELTQALYQNDASCRVIARLIKERDDARNALSNLEANFASYNQNVSENVADTAKEGSSMELDESIKDNFLEDATKIINDTFKTLSSDRKKRKSPQGLCSADSLKGFSQIGVVESLHSSTKPGILAVSANSSGDLILTGGVDGFANIYQRSSNQILAELKAHSKKTSHVCWLSSSSSDMNNVLFTGSADKTVKTWISNNQDDKDWSNSQTLKTHNSPISGLCVHPSNSFVFSSSINGMWDLSDITSGRSLFSAQLKDNLSITSCGVHPDGLIFGTGSERGKLHIWDIKTQNVLMEFDVKPPTDISMGSVKFLNFSENGYYLATACNDIVQILDLRKKAAIHTIQLSIPVSGSQAEPWSSSSLVNSVKFDRSGSYLSICGEDTRIYKSKTWNELLVVSENSMEVSDISWLDNLSNGFVTSGLDRSLRFYGLD
ncbi:Pre-mRNA-processing factor 19 [Smittium mucronatum]|uniref:Pre-mRNA-processing factor 19 n=1 Tax=Smittium mucronatum TaxID=133383 RepID=A0A1R0H5F5_9FUNG|nr:Pre-mRNA-processing factor 19 [Smittium mucronatum]